MEKTEYVPELIIDPVCSTEVVPKKLLQKTLNAILYPIILGAGAGNERILFIHLYTVAMLILDTFYPHLSKSRFQIMVKEML